MAKNMFCKPTNLIDLLLVQVLVTIEYSRHPVTFHTKKYSYSKHTPRYTLYLNGFLLEFR